MNAQTKVEPEAELDVSHITLAVPLDEIMRLKPFVSDEATRYYLNGVKFEPAADEGVMLAATDGHRLGALRVIRAIVQGEGIVRLPALKPKLDSHDRKNRQWLVVGKFAGETLALIVSAPPMADAIQAAASATLAKALLIYSTPLIDGTFPDWRRVVPTKVGRKTAAFNAKLIADFAAASGQKTAPVTLYGDNDSEPHLVDIGKGDFIGVIMPMRADEMKALPTWLTQHQLPKAKKPARRKAA